MLMAKTDLSARDKVLKETIDKPKNAFYNRVIHGDCLEHIKTLGKNSIDLVITDPPYFLDGLDTNWNDETIEKKTNKAGVVGGLPVGMKFDKEKGIELEKFYKRVSIEIYKVLKPGGYFLSFSQPRLFHRMAVGVEKAGYEIRDQYVWHYKRKSQMKAFSMEHFVDRKKISDLEKDEFKKKLGGRKTPQLRPQFESIMLAQKPKQGTFIDNWLEYETGLIDTSIMLNSELPSTVMHVEKPTKETYNCHLTVKPVALIEHLIKVFSKENQIVLDCFIGSGTTAIACMNTNRNYIGIEINERYVDIAKQRIKEKTDETETNTESEHFSRS